MSIRIYRQRINIVDYHIKTNATGNIETLANKLGLSVAGAYKFLEELKQEGFPIAYSRKENRYCYTKQGEMIGYVFVEESIDDADGRMGGVKTF
jgi:predicted transcriptional regulator